MKAEICISLAAGVHIQVTGDAKGAVFLHDVDKGVDAVRLLAHQSHVGDVQILFVVEIRKTFIVVKPLLIRLGDGPYPNGNREALRFLNGQVGAGFASFEQKPVAFQLCGAQGNSTGAAVVHLLHVQVASVGKVVSFFTHMMSILSEGITLLPPKARPGRVRGHKADSLRSAVPEGGVSGQPLGQDFSCGGEFLANESQPEEPGSHGVLGIFVLLGLWRSGSDFLCHLAQGQAKLDVAFELSGMKAVLLAACGGIELEKSEFHRAFGEGGVEVQHVMWS